MTKLSFIAHQRRRPSPFFVLDMIVDVTPTELTIYVVLQLVLQKCPWSTCMTMEWGDAEKIVYGGVSVSILSMDTPTEDSDERTHGFCGEDRRS
ncbi:hypothetical protein V3C99_006510 [Haemonchus contortus]|uniref:Uncharacterized protein n=1 Tax=Haemonchus contortus TaxID=6289 RepID=A0A7I4XRX6_HAECO